MLNDSENHSLVPTYSNMVSESLLEWQTRYLRRIDNQVKQMMNLVQDAQPGDRLFFHCKCIETILSTEVN
jgi:hypothetical protein